MQNQQCLITNQPLSNQEHPIIQCTKILEQQNSLLTTDQTYITPSKRFVKPKTVYSCSKITTSRTRRLPLWPGYTILLLLEPPASFKGPLVLPPHFLLFLWCEVILDVECLADLLWSLPLDHVGDSLAGQVQQPLDVQVVCSL